jgi:hypothetical protein
MSKAKSGKKIETGSAHLKRKFLFNKNEEDIDVPDGDILTGKKVYNDECAR